MKGIRLYFKTVFIIALCVFVLFVFAYEFVKVDNAVSVMMNGTKNTYVENCTDEYIIRFSVLGSKTEISTLPFVVVAKIIKELPQLIGTVLFG